ncbi:phage portal protein [Streptomyces sp. LBUM 1485]|nr:phage portal protein [Streptomyces sp. LBUM 1485]
MRELELVNRHIVAQYLSRLASAGVVIFPDEVTFPVREEFADAADPFMEEWVENARTAISTPGTAAAVVPMPIKVPAEYVDKIAHIDFTLKIDDKIIEKRDSAIKRLASQLNVPPEVLLGMGDLNHWNAWAVDETSLKVNVAPDAELIAAALTTGYLQPRLKASFVEDWANWVVWYDMSELTLRPDRSDSAIALYDRLEINGAALRRETGFNEADKPTDEELKEQGLKIIIKTLPSGGPAALSELTGESITITPVTPAAPGEAPAADPEPPPEDQSMPDETAAREASAAARSKRLIQQSQAMHAVRFAAGRPPDLLHPALCSQHAYSCPFTHAAVKLAQLPRPGTSGTYEARLSPFGQLVIGQRAPLLDTSAFLTTASPSRSSNGHAHSRR